MSEAVRDGGTRDSGVRERTRGAIVRAAITTLGVRPAATLGDVAEDAGVARSTLHRYFADRAALRAAIDEFVQDEYRAAVQRARPDEGSGAEAFARVVGELLDAQDVFAWWMSSEPADDEQDDPVDGDVAAIVERGQRDGSIDPDLTPVWLVHMIWTSLYAAHHYPPAENATRREVRDLCRRSLVKLAAAPRG